jgi:hypothetical protein
VIYDISKPDQWKAWLLWRGTMKGRGILYQNTGLSGSIVETTGIDTDASPQAFETIIRWLEEQGSTCRERVKDLAQWN